MKYLLDACILSETVRPRPDERVLRWFQTTERTLLYTSAVVIGEIDSQIAAIALHHDMTLVARNVKDMESTGVRLFNPFE